MFISGNATVPLQTGCMLDQRYRRCLPSRRLASGLIIHRGAKNELQIQRVARHPARNSAVAFDAALAGVLVATVGPGLTLLIDGLVLVFPQSGQSLLQPSLKWRSCSAQVSIGLAGIQPFILGFGSSYCIFSLIVAAIEAVFGLLGPARQRAFDGFAKGLGLHRIGPWHWYSANGHCWACSTPHPITACCFSP